MMKHWHACALALGITAHSPAMAGWIFQDVPTEIMSNPSTARTQFGVDMPLEATANRLQMMHALCSPGQTVNAAVDKQNGLLITWLTASTVSHIFELTSADTKTAVTLYMNVKVDTQKKVWPLLYDEWFVRGGKRCAQELLDQASKSLASGEVRPNPSLEWTHTGMALGPRGVVVHHPPRGPSAIPVRSPQLKR